MDFPRREALRTRFDEMAGFYDRARPRYPAAVYDDLIELAHLRPPARLLEIGPGSGIATRVLAERGFDIVGVELSEEMAEVGRVNLGGFERVEIVSSTVRTTVEALLDVARKGSSL